MGAVCEFTAESALMTFRIACREAGIDHRGVELIRLGENAVFRIPFLRIVGRVGRSADRELVARKEVAVARWLHGQGAPVAAPAEQVPEQPIVVDGRVVTFWEEIVSPEPSSPRALGEALWQLHRMVPPDELLLPQVRPLARVRDRLATAHTLSHEDREFLDDLATELEGKFAASTFELPAAVVHGDAHVDNLVRGADGRLAFVDLEEFALGQPEWDLVLTAIERDCGWVSDEEYEEFTVAYDYDVTTAPAYTALREIRLLRMTSWLSQMAADSAEVEAEVRRRVRDLRTGSSIAGWRAF